MPYPSFVPVRTVVVGPAHAVEDPAGALNVRIKVEASRALIWAEDGYRLERAGLTTSTGVGEDASLILPRTDVAGWKDARTGALIDVSAPNSFTHTYTAYLTFSGEDGRGVGARYEVGPFVVPAGSGPILLADLLDAPGEAGGTVSIPDSWTALYAAALAAAQATNTALALKADRAPIDKLVPLSQTKPKPRLLMPRFLNPNDPFPAPVTADVPTILETASSSTTISSGVLKAPLRTVASGPWDTTDPNFEISGTPVVEAYSSFASTYLQSQRHVGAPSDAYVWKMNVAFETNSEEVEFKLIAASASPKFGLIRVNGRFVSMASATLTATGGSQLAYKLTFPDSSPRLIEVFSIMPRGGFGGVWVRPSRYLVRPKRKAATKLAIIGSSITDGALLSGNAETYAIRLAHMMGADQIILGGVGGSGYLTKGVGNSQFRDRIAGVLAQNPDILLIEGSRNDWVSGRGNGAAIQAEVEYVLDQTASIPERYGLSIITAGTEYTYINDAVKAGFAAKGVPYGDVAGAIFGTGYSGVTNNSGNSDYYIGTDAVHPTAAGHVKLAQWYADAIAGAYSIAIR